MQPIFATILVMVLSMTACAPQKSGSQAGSTPLQTSDAALSPSLSTTPLTPSATHTQTPQPSAIPTTAPSPIPPSATPDVKIELVNFTTQDDIKLAGTVFGEGDLAVILAHMGMPDVDQESWQPFARLLAERGFTALTFDFRGRGKSKGNPVFNRLPHDVDAAIQFLQDWGYERIVCIGASMGGTACMRAALDHDLVGLGVIASVMSNGKPNQVSAYEVQQLTLPKVLVYAGNEAPAVVIDMKIISDLAPEPKLVQVYQASAHGTNLFNTEYGGQLTELLIGFLEAILSNSPLPTPQGGEHETVDYFMHIPEHNYLRLC